MGSIKSGKLMALRSDNSKRGFIDLYDRAGKLLARFDPARDLLEIGKRGEVTLIDLSQYRQARTERAEDSGKGQSTP